jgi:hypothetical protein
MILSVLLVLFGLLMTYRGLAEKTAGMNVDLALGIILVVYGISRYFLYSRSGNPRD